MSHAEGGSDDARERTERKRLGWAIVAGLALGAVYAVPRYGVFHMMTVALAGLGLITVVAIYAAVIALLPARPLPARDAPRA